MPLTKCRESVHGDCLSHGLQTSSEVANTFVKLQSIMLCYTGMDRGVWPQKETYLDKLVPARGDNDGVLGVGRETDARDPLGVALVGDGELAVTESVPQLDGAVTGAGDDLAVVGGEGDGQDVVVVADEAAGGGAGGQLPESQGLVPRGGQSVGAVGGDDLSEFNPSAYLFLSPKNHAPALD